MDGNLLSLTDFPVHDRWHFKNGLKNNLSSYGSSKMQKFTREVCPQHPIPPLPDPPKQKGKKKLVQCLGVVCDLAMPLPALHI